MRDAPEVDAAVLDGPQYCSAPDGGGGSSETQLCQLISGDCLGDVCGEDRCFYQISVCLQVRAFPDGTPCDDNDPNSFVYPCNPGACPANHCVGGPNAGASCDSNSDCCAGGSCAGESGACDGSFCVSGSETSHRCSVDSDCPKAGRCEIWTCDDMHHYCVGRADNPFCNTQADCPTTKYCAYGYDLCGNGDRCTDSSGNDNGPCFQWTCNTTTQRCESPPSCGGGFWGFDGSCKNVCRSGVCSRDFVICQ
jgi:hypothetical protein